MYIYIIRVYKYVCDGNVDFDTTTDVKLQLLTTFEKFGIDQVYTILVVENN